METVVTKYPELGVELRTHSSYDGRGEGATDCGSAVYTTDGKLVDTSGAVTPQSWVMRQLMQREKEVGKQAAIARIRVDLAALMAKSQTTRVQRDIRQLEENLARLNK